MSNPPVVPLAAQRDIRRQHSAQDKGYGRRFLVGALISLVGLATLLVAWISYALALNFSLAWALIGAGGLQGALAFGSNAAGPAHKPKLQADLVVLKFGVGMIYVSGGLTLILSPGFNQPLVLASILFSISVLQGLMAWQIRPAVGWGLTALNSGVGTLLAWLIVLPWGANSPLVMGCLVGL
ncbi:MAG: hypothetical protein AAGC54_04005, partial [Cyanobacteria bacterium P01_F01_bin.4]